MIDTHCHLNLVEAFPDVQASVREAIAAGVTRLIVIGIDLETSRRALEIAEAHEGVFATVGIHPNSSSEYSGAELADLEEMLAHPKAVAVGEIGLDYHWRYASQEKQKRSLVDQIALAKRLSKPAVFHCREAYDDLLDILADSKPSPWLLHCFSGNSQHARKAVGLGCYFGVDGPITYPKAKELREVVAALPRDRLVIETDSPYLTPVPHRGKPNKPAYLPLVNQGLAECLGLEPDECARLTTDNAERFLGLRS